MLHGMWDPPGPRIKPVHCIARQILNHETTREAPAAAATAAKSLQSCPTLCDPIDGIQFFVTPWIIAHQAALSMGFSRQEYWPG